MIYDVVNCHAVPWHIRIDCRENEHDLFLRAEAHFEAQFRFVDGKWSRGFGIGFPKSIDVPFREGCGIFVLQTNGLCV